MSAGRRLWLLAAVPCLAAVGACSSGSNLPPAQPLPPNPQKVQVHRDWSHDVGGGGGRQLLGLSPDARDGLVVAASAGGNVVAVDATSGRVKWRHHLGARLSGGPAVGDGLVAVGTRSGKVIALDAKTGKPKWRQYVGAPVNTAPAISNSVVVVKTIAGDVTGLTPADGKELWTRNESVPSLSLRFDTRPLIVDGTAYAGFADGKAMAIDVSTGKAKWRQQVATGQGGNLVADMVDVGGSMAYAGGDLYVATYQGKLAALDDSSGQTIWSRSVSSYTGVTLDGSHLYVSDADGSVHAFDLVTGVPDWVYGKLGYRGLSAPVSDGSIVAVGDRFGYLHFLDRSNGAYLGRVSVGGGPIRMPPVVVDNRVVVLDLDGTLAAYRVSMRKSK